MPYKKPWVNVDSKVVEKSRIAFVGVELEGIWEKIPKGVQWVGRQHPRASQIGRDGSLDPLAQRHPQYEVVGELPSPPLQESKIESWMRALWPSVIGPECGLHVHISLKTPLIYMKLMDERYCATVIHYLKEWAKKEEFPADHPVWDRLNDKCIYCQHVFMADEQVKNMQKDYEKHRLGHRYTAINYCYSRDGQGPGTIECRVLPMTPTVDAGIRAVKEFLSVTNRYLVATATREKKFKTSFVFDTENGHFSRLKASV